jgi:hypothetical protein
VAQGEQRPRRGRGGRRVSRASVEPPHRPLGGHGSQTHGACRSHGGRAGGSRVPLPAAAAAATPPLSVRRAGRGCGIHPPCAPHLPPPRLFDRSVESPRLQTTPMQCHQGGVIPVVNTIPYCPFQRYSRLWRAHSRDAWELIPASGLGVHAGGGASGGHPPAQPGRAAHPCGVLLAGHRAAASTALNLNLTFLTFTFALDRRSDRGGGHCHGSAECGRCEQLGRVGLLRSHPLNLSSQGGAWGSGGLARRTSRNIRCACQPCSLHPTSVFHYPTQGSVRTAGPNIRRSGVRLSDVSVDCGADRGRAARLHSRFG